MSVTLTAGFVALVDAAPLIIAKELGFAEEEGLNLELRRAPSWSTLRDLLALGQIEAAQMLSPIPVAMALGLGGMKTRLDALSVMSVNGNVIGVSNQLAAQLREMGHPFGFNDAQAAGQALIATGKRLRIGVPFPFSMHAELLYYWLNSLGMAAPQSLDIRTVPPPLMADALAAGEIDAFCVGEPWGSITVENGTGELLLPLSAVWNFAPEKVLAVRHEWTKSDPELSGRLLRAVWRAGRWLGNQGAKTTAAEILSRSEYIAVSPEVIDRAISGQMVISARGDERFTPGFLEFYAGAATFPWKSQAGWIGAQIAGRLGLDRTHAIQTARDVFRPDLYREFLSGTSAEIPGASEKLEGSLTKGTPVPSRSGSLILPADTFFDGRIFDPHQSI